MLGPLFHKPEDIMRVILAAALSLVMHAAALAQTSPGCPQKAVDSSQWLTHDEGAFTLRLPPGLERQPSSGIDSQVRLWSSDSLRVSYDYGYYSNPLTAEYAEHFPGLRVCEEAGAHGSPRVVIYQTKDGLAGLAAHWAQLSQDAFGTMSLSVFGAARDPEQRAVLLAIIRSVRFKP
jgi:hypothetical protein